LIKNGLISINADPTKYNITAGIGVISNFDDPENPVSTIVNFPAVTAKTPTYLTSGNITYIAINASGVVVEQATPFTTTQRRDLILLGAVIHSNLTNINVVNNISAPTNADTNQLHDFMEAIGALNLTGNKYTANGANLSLDKSAGSIFKFGVNFAADWKKPHELSQSAGTALTFRYRTQTGTEGSDVTTLNPALYDLAGTLTTVPVNKFTIQTVTIFQTGLTRIQYGQNYYNSLEEAQAAIFTRNYVPESNIAQNGITRAYIILRNTATSLLNISDAKIIEAQKFGGVASGGVALTLANIVTALGYTPENVSNKQNSLTIDGTGTKYPTVDAVNAGLGVAQKDVAYVDINGNNATAILGNIRKPFLTIDAALDALPATGGVVKIGIGTFNSPVLAKVKDNVSFLGNGKPTPNLTVTYIDEITKPTITSPTYLIGGTILNGKFDVSLKNNIKVKDLGVDVGKAWVDTFNGGVAVDGFVSAQDTSFPSQPTSPQTKGLVLENIAVLGYSATSLYHNTLVENAFSPQINNLSTYYNTYGLVLKSAGANIVNFDGHGHGGDAIIVKADTYAYSQNINLSNLYISSIGAYDCAGITLSGGSGNLQRVNISNANIEFTKNALKSDGVVDEINVVNMNIKSTSERAIYLPASVKNATLTNIIQDGTGSGYNGIQLESDNNGVKIISNSKSSNTLGVGFSFTATGTGKVIVNGLDSYNNTTSYGINGNVYGSNITKNTTQTGELIFDSYGKIRALRSFVTPTGGVDSNVNILSSNTSGFSGVGILASNSSSSFIHFGDTDNSSVGQIEYYHGDNSMNFKVDGNIPIVLSSGGATLTGTPTAPTATAGTNTTQIATTAFVQENARPYKVYTALLFQSGTAAPVDTIIENNIGATITWARTSIGVYTASFSSSILDSVKTIVFVTSDAFGSANNLISSSRTSSSVVTLRNTVAGSAADISASRVAIEIRVYN